VSKSCGTVANQDRIGIDAENLRRLLTKCVAEWLGYFRSRSLVNVARIASKTRGEGEYGFSLVLSLMIPSSRGLFAGRVTGHRQDVGSHGSSFRVFEFRVPKSVDSELGTRNAKLLTSLPAPPSARPSSAAAETESDRAGEFRYSPRDRQVLLYSPGRSRRRRCRAGRCGWKFHDAGSPPEIVGIEPAGVAGGTARRQHVRGPSGIVAERHRSELAEGKSPPRCRSSPPNAFRMRV